MTSEQYRTYLIESIKIGAQMMHDMAEDIAGTSDIISFIFTSSGFTFITLPFLSTFA